MEQTKPEGINAVAEFMNGGQVHVVPDLRRNWRNEPEEDKPRFIEEIRAECLEATGLELDASDVRAFLDGQDSDNPVFDVECFLDGAVDGLGFARAEYHDSDQKGKDALVAQIKQDAMTSWGSNLQVSAIIQLLEAQGG